LQGRKEFDSTIHQFLISIKLFVVIPQAQKEFTKVFAFYISPAYNLYINSTTQ